jgi:hypothetical protein
MKNANNYALDYAVFSILFITSSPCNQKAPQQFISENSQSIPIFINVYEMKTSRQGVVIQLGGWARG